MRILMVDAGPHFSVADVHSGWRRAFQKLGCQVANVNLSDRLSLYSLAMIERDGQFIPALSADAAVRMAGKGVQVVAYEFWPDVVVITSAFFIPDETLDLLRARGHTVVILMTESPYEDQAQLQRARHADLVILNDPTNLAAFQEVTDAYYQPHSYDPAVHHRREPKADLLSDFAFVGTGFPSRTDFFEAVDWDGIDATFAGNWRNLSERSPILQRLAHEQGQCVDNTDAVDLYASTKASANLYRVESEPDAVDGWAMGPREVELAACGTFFLRDPRGEGDDLFPMLPTFDGPQDFGDKLRWWLARPHERAQAADAARAAVESRTFEAAARTLLAKLT